LAAFDSARECNAAMSKTYEDFLDAIYLTPNKIDQLAEEAGFTGDERRAFVPWMERAQGEITRLEEFEGNSSQFLKFLNDGQNTLRHSEPQNLASVPSLAPYPMPHDRDLAKANKRRSRQPLIPTDRSRSCELSCAWRTLMDET
jgi:hypothetical protein